MAMRCVYHRSARGVDGHACLKRMEEIRMDTCFPRIGHVIAAAAFAVTIAALNGSSALAQDKPAAAKPPSAEEVERRRGMGGYHPERMKNPNLSGHPYRMTITPPERVQLDKIQLPPGFQVEIWSHGHPGGRMMTRGDKGIVFMGTRAIGRVYAVMDRDGKRTVKVLAEK